MGINIIKGQKKKVILSSLIIVILLLLGSSHSLVVYSLTPTQSQYSNDLSYTEERLENENLIIENENGNGNEEWTYLYPNQYVRSYFSSVLSDGNFLVCLSEEERGEENIQIIIYPDEIDIGKGTTGFDESIRSIHTTANDDVYIFGSIRERKEYAPSKPFYYTFSYDTGSFIAEQYFDSIGQGWIEEYQILNNGNILILIRDLTYSTSLNLLLYELNPSTGSIEWEMNFTNIAYTADSYGEFSFQHLHVTDNEDIVLFGRNRTNDGAFMARGKIGGTWSNYTFSEDIEFKGGLIDNSGNAHLALERENKDTSETEIDVIKVDDTFNIISNYTFSDSSASYHVRRFIINLESDSFDLPFIVYEIFGNEDYPGLGFTYVDTTTLLQSEEFSPSNFEEYSYSEPFAFDDSWVIASVAGTVDSADVIINRKGSSPWSRTIDGSFTNLASVRDFQIDKDNDIWINILDATEDRGLYLIGSSFGEVKKQITLDETPIFPGKLRYYSYGDDDYIAFYGIQGDFSNNEGEAAIAIFSTDGNLLNNRIRVPNYGLNEYWETIHITDNFLYLMGTQYDINDYTHQSIIVAKYAKDQIRIRDYREVSRISINGFHSIADNYGNIITGEGTENDPYVFERLIIDGDKDPDGSNYHGIEIRDLWEDGRKVVFNDCIIKNWAAEWSSGIAIFNAYGITIYNCTIIDNKGSSGIYLERANEVNISNNLIDNNVGHGIAFSSDPTTNDALITENTITNTKAWQEWHGNGIYLVGHNNEITYNTIQYNNKYGIELGHLWDDDDIRTTNNYIGYNDLCHNADGGINIEAKHGNVYEGNECGFTKEDDFFDKLPFEIPFNWLSAVLSLGFIGVTTLILRKRK